MTIQAPFGEFNLSRLERVIYGPGKVAALKDEMERRELARALVVTTDVVAELPVLKDVTGALGPRCAGVFAGRPSSRTANPLSSSPTAADA